MQTLSLIATVLPLSLPRAAPGRPRLDVPGAVLVLLRAGRQPGVRGYFTCGNRPAAGRRCCRPRTRQRPQAGNSRSRSLMVMPRSARHLPQLLERRAFHGAESSCASPSLAAGAQPGADELVHERRFFERSGASSRTMRPALDQQHALGERPDEVEALLHQQQRQPAARRRSRSRSAMASHDRGLDALGRLVEQEQPGPVQSARASASNCCSPPESAPPGRSTSRPSSGNSSSTRPTAAVPRPDATAASRRFSRTDRPGKICRPWGT